MIPRLKIKMVALVAFAGVLWLDPNGCFAQVTPPNPPPVVPTPRPAPKPEPEPEPAPVPEVVLPSVQTRIEQPMMPMRVLGPGPVLRFQLDLSRLPELTLLPPLRREEEE